MHFDASQLSYNQLCANSYDYNKNLTAATVYIATYPACATRAELKFELKAEANPGRTEAGDGAVIVWGTGGPPAKVDGA